MESEEDKLYCPVCGSSHLHVDNKGFSSGQAVAGALITGKTTGLLAGFIGSDDIKITCLECGCSLKPGTLLTNPEESLKFKDKNKFDDFIAIKNGTKKMSAGEQIMWILIWGIVMMIVAVAC